MSIPYTTQRMQPVPGGGRHVGDGTASHPELRQLVCYHGAMPSWNVHIYHAQQALSQVIERHGSVLDADAYVFGSVVPDIYVGFMVPDCTRKIPYRQTHFTVPSALPEPQFWEFWDNVGVTSAAQDGQVDGMVLGAWGHLIADNVYNHLFNAYIESIGVPVNDDTRIRKQGDLAMYGRTLQLADTPQPTQRLLAQGAAFPQYEIDQQDMRSALQVMSDLVTQEREQHIDGIPDYRLLTPQLVDQMRTVTDQLTLRGLEAYLEGGASAAGFRPSWAE